MAPYTFSNEEMADIHFMYGRANGNACRAARFYHEAFPERRQPDSRVFTRSHQRLRETGAFTTNLRIPGRPRTVSTPQVEERVLQSVDENPGTSTRRIAAAENVSQTTVWRILREQQLYPYHVQRVQALGENDFQPRVAFSQWILTKCGEDPQFLCNILFTDEAGFTRDGVVNFHKFGRTKTLMGRWRRHISINFPSMCGQVS